MNVADFLFVAAFVIKTKNKWQKSDKHFKLVSLTSFIGVLFMRFELPLTPPPPPPPSPHTHNISNGPYDQYVVEVIVRSKLIGWLFPIRLSGGRWDDLVVAIMLAT